MKTLVYIAIAALLSLTLVMSNSLSSSSAAPGGSMTCKEVKDYRDGLFKKQRKAGNKRDLYPKQSSTWKYYNKRQNHYYSLYRDAFYYYQKAC